jgi:hypothetical protein
VLTRCLSFACALGLAGCQPGEDAPGTIEFDASLPDGGEDGRREDCDVPSETAELIAFLRAGTYRSFARESARHPSAGPHFGEVITYLNPVLEASLADGANEHPACAAAVKELFVGEDTVQGWAVFVKVRERSQDGAGFYWFETTSTAADGEPDFAADGIALCAGCHRSGTDFVRAPYPLQ